MTADGEQCLTTLEAPTHFGDLGLLLARRTASARAVTDVQSWRLPRRRFEQLVRDRPAVGLAVAASLAEAIDRRSREYAGAPTLRTELPKSRPIVLSRPGPAPAFGRCVAAGALALGIPFVLWWLPPPQGLDVHGWRITAVLLGAAIAWLLEPVPEFVIALALAVSWGLTGLAPLSHVFGGFISSSYMVAFGALGLAAAMGRSGLLFRIALLLLKTFPRTYGGQVLALLAGGVAVTPIMPIATARVAMITPVAQDVAEALSQPPRTRGSAGLAFAGIIGYGSFGCIFLTGLVANFFILSLLPPSDRTHLDWLRWLVNAAPAGVILFAGTFATLLVCFRTAGGTGTTAETLQRQQRFLGPLSQDEIVTIAGLAIFFAGLLLGPLLRVDGAWLALAALVLVVAAGVLDRESFRGSIEWGYLIFFGVLLGTGTVLRSGGVDRWIGDGLIPLSRAMGGPGRLAVALSLGVVAARLVLPQIPAMYLLSLALVPAAPRLGLSPWVAGFVIQLTAYTWLHPRQSDYYRLTRGITRGEMTTDRYGIIAGVALTAVTLVAIASSVPYWRLIGTLRP
ncbi:MAG TPA: SLC13 family permease [bacterium]|nr:SLC13 family permease [bacterium]